VLDVRLDHGSQRQLLQVRQLRHDQRLRVIVWSWSSVSRREIRACCRAGSSAVAEASA
jgi:hypothetical protein